MEKPASSSTAILAALVLGLACPGCNTPTARRTNGSPAQLTHGQVQMVSKTADIETGLIQAASPTKNVVFFGSHMSNTEANAFIEELQPGRTSIRLNFVEAKESSSGYGMKTRADKPIVDPKVYESAFAKIQEAIFIRSSVQ